METCLTMTDDKVMMRGTTQCKGSHVCKKLLLQSCGFFVLTTVEELGDGGGGEVLKNDYVKAKKKENLFSDSRDV